ncbi:MAG TPA: hypothetical protein VF360_01765 [Candidatus Methanoperedens sp.]
MRYGKMILFAGLAGLVVGFYISVTTTLLVLLLGLLFVPPVVAIVSTIYEGISELLKENVMSRKEYFVVYPAASET